MRVPIFLGGLAGQVLRYDPGTTQCRGEMVKHPYQVVREPRAGATGEFAVGANSFIHIPGARGKSYCKKL